MKAVVILLSLVVLCSAHSIEKRSLLGRQHGHGHDDHHHQHTPRQRFRFSGSRVGRDGEHHHEDRQVEIRGASTSYLPADEDDLAWYESSGDVRSEGLPGYSNGEEYDDYEESSGAASDQDYAAPGDIYGSPSNLDSAYAAPEGEVSREATDEYGSPAEEDVSREVANEYGAPPDYTGNGFPFGNVEGKSTAGDGSEGERVCPGGSLSACVEVCPGVTARVYGACVQGCGDRCP